jgi:hypothetical protein
MYTYTSNIGIVNSLQLHTEICASDIVPQLVKIHVNYMVKIIFNSPLSSLEYTTLNAIILNHYPQPSHKNMSVNLELEILRLRFEKEIRKIIDMPLVLIELVVSFI